ncbi:MAG: M56 family metallopeptidase [Tomitella sp.]|nr:M56 family metallopeptidase [Tomitella sp.]
MIVALGLLVAMAVIGFGAPRYLAMTVAPGLNPRLALTAWTTSVVLTLAALIAAPLSMLTMPGRNTFGAAHACLGQLRDQGSLPWLDATQVVLTVASAALALFLIGAVVRRLLAHRRSTAQHLRTVSLAADAAIGGGIRSHRGIPILWVDAPSPVCYNVRGRHPTIVASRHLAELPADQRLAVFEHEYAHLCGHHHILVVAAEALAAAMPIMPLFRAAPGAVRTLVEFAADQRAAACHGAENVGGALLTVQSIATDAASETVARGPPPPPAPAGAGASQATVLALSGDAMAARLWWLGTEPSRRQRLCAPMDYPVALAVALVPLALSVTAMFVTAALVCLQLRS